jgi:phosphatidate cytidylyltransferase
LDLHPDGRGIDGARTDKAGLTPGAGREPGQAGPPAGQTGQAGPAPGAGREPGQAGPPAGQTGQAGLTPGAGGEPGQAGQRSSRAGRNLPAAIAVGAGLGGCVVVTLFTVKSTFLIVMGAAVAIAIGELGRALRVRDIIMPVILLYAGGAALWTCGYWLGYRAAFAALGLTVIGVLGWRLRRPAAGYVRDATAGIFALFYLPVLGLFAVFMLSAPDGAHRVFLFVVITVCSDIGGFFAGAYLGRHRLAPAISPNKTWEGLAGSALGCLVAGGVLLPVLLPGHAWQGVLLGAAVFAVATLGDLAESMIKRDLGIKDMGTVLPGHGGILDRIDALLLSAPVAWLLLAAFTPR